MYLEDYSEFNQDFTIRSFGNHGLPSLLLIAEWMINGIDISWRVLPIVVLVGIAYLVVNLSVVIDQGLDFIYPTHNWMSHPWEAFAFTVLIFTILIGIMALLIWL